MEANLDDLSPEFYEELMERLFASGALDVFFTPIQMKKQRPATLLSVLAPPDKTEEIARTIYLSEKTVRNYVSVILSKLNVSTRSEAAAYAVKHHVQDHLTPEP